MCKNQSFLLGLSCLIGLAGACDDGVTPPLPPTAGGSPQTTAGTSAPTGGTGTAGTGTSGGTAGSTPSSGTGGTGVATAGTTAPAAGTGSGASGTGAAGMSAPPPGLPNGFKACGKPKGAGQCMATAPGVYAVRTELDVWWKDENNGNQADGTGYLIDPGRGKLTIWFRGTIKDVCEDGSGGIGELRPCGTRLPAFISDVASSAILIEFPDALWESDKIPTYTTSGSTSGFNPGDTLTIGLTAGLLGLELMGDPMTAKFPTWEQTVDFACNAGKGDMCFPDHDGDGKPGVTVSMRSTGNFDDAPYKGSTGMPLPFKPAPVSSNPLDLLNGTGAKTVYTGLRTALGGSGKIAADCKSGAGSATAAMDAIQSRATACVLNTGGACSDAQIEFVDKNVPNFHIMQKGESPPASPMWGVHNRAEAKAALDALRGASKGPLSAVVRLGDLGATPTCADVRNATYPAGE